MKITITSIRLRSPFNFLPIFFFFLLGKNVNAQCNGYESLCDKTYDEVAYLTTHNAPIKLTASHSN